MNREAGTELRLDFEKRGGLLPVIVQDFYDKEVLMLGWANPQAFDLTCQTGNATFWSTSRKELWEKGATSGDYLKIKEIRVDCDQDTLIYLVEKQGSGACHTKDPSGKTRSSCFYRKVEGKSLVYIP